LRATRIRLGRGGWCGREQRYAAAIPIAEPVESRYAENYCLAEYFPQLDGMSPELLREQGGAKLLILAMPAPMIKRH
jgi:hypothetical protein